MQGKTIKDYALERLFPAPGTEEQALEDLKALLQQRLAEAQRGELSSKSITQIGRDAAESGRA